MNVHRLKRTDDDDDDRPAPGSHAGGDSSGLLPGDPRLRPRPRGDGTKTDIWVYHERQESLLCGQHCLNNLLQQAAFTPMDLADIAHGLDAQEAQLYLDGANQADKLRYLAESSGNVDESGNYSLEVLKNALLARGVELLSWTGEVARTVDPLTETAFIVNRSSHWFTIRTVGPHYWNLNSTSDRPEMISDFFLSAFLAQLREEKYSVFIAKGSVPRAGGMPSNLHDPSPQNVDWWTVRELLLPPSAGGKDGIVIEAEKNVFAGAGNKLGGGAGGGGAGGGAIDISEEEDDELMKQMKQDDPELAMALELSR